MINILHLFNVSPTFINLIIDEYLSEFSNKIIINI